MQKENDDSVDQARVVWQHLLNEMTWNGPTPSLNQKGLEMIAGYIRMKKIGRWDELLGDDELEAELLKDTVQNDIAKLIDAWFVATLEAREFKTPPSMRDENKSLFRLVSQIIKTIKEDYFKPELTGWNKTISPNDIVNPKVETNEPMGSDDTGSVDTSSSKLVE